jgi:hypothetical protein
MVFSQLEDIIMKNFNKMERMSLEGPWLISEDTLLMFDTIMEKSYKELIHYEETRSEDYPIDHKLSLSIWYKNESETKFNSFKEALISNQHKNMKPIKFLYSLNVKYNKIELELDTMNYNNFFSYYINCEDNSLENNIIYEIQKLYLSEKPKKLCLLTNKIGNWIWILYFLFILISSYIILENIQRPLENYIRSSLYNILSKDVLIQDDFNEIIRYSVIHNFRLHSLLDNEILLQNQIRMNNLFFSFLIIGFIVSLFISLRHKASFSVGKGKVKVLIWKTYYKIILYAIPVCIILPIIVNVITKFIFR